MQPIVIPPRGVRAQHLRPLMDGHGPDASVVGLPEVFGAYTLTRRIGRGGWATVYEARPHAGTHPRLQPDARRSPNTPPDLRVALKRLERVSPSAIERMQREGQLLQALNSPRVPRLLDQGMVGGVPFLVMALVEGVDLATLLYRLRVRRQLLPTEILLEVLLQLGLALRVAHTWLDPQLQRPVPIVHGDLKPANVLIGQDGSVLLTDFGSALHAGASEELLDDIPGTAGYAAPERVTLLTPPPLSPSSDLFALGLVGFELCTLSPLFSGSSAQMLQQLVQADAYIPVALTRLPPELHPKIVTVLTRLLAPTPEERYAHIDDALRPLQDLQLQLKLKAELASFVTPYLTPGPGERLEVRVTNGSSGLDDGWRGPETGSLLGGAAFRRGPRLTHLTRAQLKALIPPPHRKPLTLADLAETEQRRQRTRILQGLGILLLCLVGIGFLMASLPYHIEVKSTPGGALASLQPGCEGKWSASQLTPATLRTKGPWPVCVAVEAPGHIRGTAKVLEPSIFTSTRFVTLTLDREVCLKVGSRPPGLQVYVDNRPRGATGLDDLRICGLTPFEPYVVQMDYDNVRWDIKEVVGKPGEELSVFQDFSVHDEVTASPFERCSRYFSAGELPRAIELCRVAVVESPTLEQKLEALLLQGRAHAAQDDVETACDLFAVAQDRAVYARRLELERRVVDVRIEYDCEAVEAARALREEAELNGSPVPEDETADAGDAGESPEVTSSKPSKPSDPADKPFKLKVVAPSTALAGAKSETPAATTTPAGTAPAAPAAKAPTSPQPGGKTP